MIRRREKRRHLTPNSIDLRDPYSVIALAIRFDESMASAGDDDSLLEVPLETGSLYNQKAFAKALLNLQKQTAVPRQASSPRKPRVPSDPSTSSVPQQQQRQAITPVILSGFVAAIQERAEEDKGPSAVELVAYCRSMRRAALSRIRLRRQRRRVQRNVTPFVVLAIVLVLVFWSTSSMRATILEYGFVGGEEEGSCQSNKACRLAATRVWEYCDPSHRLNIAGCTHEDCPAVEGQIDYPAYAMHTIARIAYMPISEIDRPRKLHSTRTWPLRRQPSSPRKVPALRWLGDTNLNQLVRESIDRHLSPSTPIFMLDCGCGIAGTLYAMLDDMQSSTPPRLFRYHGIALSAPEIYQGNQYLDLHGLNIPEAKEKFNSGIFLEPRDFDEPLLPDFYTVIVAIESLAYSANLSRTINNMVSSLSKGGIIIVMDDILAPWVSDEAADELRNEMGTPSLRTYQEWKTIIKSIPSLNVQVVWDLSLEFDMRDMVGGDGPESSLVDIWGDWRYRIAQTLAGYWTAWFGGKRKIGKNAPLQLFQLAKNLAEKDKATRARQQAYARADISYYYFVLTKD
jgi:hypothetical protein